MHHSNRRAYLKLLLPSILVFVFLQGASFRQPEPPPFPVAPADIFILVDRSKSLDFVYDDVIDSVRFTLRYLETFDPDGRNFRVSIIPFAGDVKRETELERLRPDFWREFEREFGYGAQENTDFSRAFCQLQRTIDNQQGPGIDRQVIIFLFSDGKSEPFGETNANDRQFKECLTNIQGTLSGKKTSEEDTRIATSIFENIISRNYSDQKPTLYTVAFRTPDGIDADVDSLWWQKTSADYIAFCTKEDDFGCTNTQEKSQLMDFLNNILNKKILGIKIGLFEKSSSTMVEIQPSPYTLEMRVSVLPNIGVTLKDPSGQLQKPIQSEADFLIFRIPVSGNDIKKTWKLILPEDSSYRIDFFEPSLQVTTDLRYVWSGHSPQINIEMNGRSGSERLPEVIALGLRDGGGESVRGIETNLLRVTPTKWTGVFNVDFDPESNPYTLYLVDNMLEKLIVDWETVKVVNIIKSPRLGDWKAKYDPNIETWEVSASIINSENLAINPKIGANILLVGRSSTEQEIPAIIIDDQLFIKLSAKDFPAGVYLVNLKLNSGESVWGATPEEYFSLPINLYQIPNIENININSKRRSFEIYLSNYFSYEELYVEFSSNDKNVRRSDELTCTQYGDIEKCEARFPFFIQDINSNYEFNKVVLIGELASGNEVFLDDDLKSGIVFPLSLLEIFKNWFLPNILTPLTIIIVCFLLFSSQVSPTRRVSAIENKISRAGAAGRGITRESEYRRLFRVGKIPRWNDIKTIEKYLKEIINRELSSMEFRFPVFEEIERSISIIPDRKQRETLFVVYEELMATVLKQCVDLPGLLNFINRLDHFKVINDSDFLFRARWFDDISRSLQDDSENSSHLKTISEGYNFFLGISKGNDFDPDFLYNSPESLLNSIIENIRTDLEKFKIKKAENLRFFNNELIVDFEIPEKFLTYLDFKVNHSALYLRFSSSDDSIKRRIICLGKSGLCRYDWETALPGSKFRLIIDRPSPIQEVKISIGMLGDKQDYEFLTLENIKEPDSVYGDSSWFVTETTRLVWGKFHLDSIRHISRVVKEDQCNEEYINKKNLIDEFHLRDNDLADNLETDNVVRFSGWAILSPDKIDGISGEVVNQILTEILDQLRVIAGSPIGIENLINSSFIEYDHDLKFMRMHVNSHKLLQLLQSYELVTLHVARDEIKGPRLDYVIVMQIPKFLSKYSL